MPNNIYEKICRVCLGITTSDNMVTLFDNSNVDGLSMYGTYMKMLSNISLKSKYFLPSNICSKCLEMLKQAMNFKLTCEKSENVFLSIKDIDAESRTSVPRFKQKLIEYSLYRHYFKEDDERSECNDMHSDLFYNENISDSQSNSESIDQFEYNFKEEKLKTEKPSLNDSVRDMDEANFLLDMMEESLRSNLGNCNNYTQKEKKFQTSMSKSERSMFLNKMSTVIPKQLFQPKHIYTQEDLTCKYCHKVLKNHVTYKNHIQIHTRDYSFICEICGKGYILKHELDHHRITKHDIGPHIKCKLCDFKTGRRYDMKEHLRIHTGERPWTCEICGMTFRRRYIWRQHKIRHTEKTEACPHCSRLFHRKHELLDHINCVHERSYMYMCYKCDVLYTKISTVRKHLVEKHGIARSLQGNVKRIVKRNGDALPSQC